MQEFNQNGRVRVVALILHWVLSIATVAMLIYIVLFGLEQLHML